MFSEILRPYKHGFANVQHYLENKKPTLLAFNPELVYAAILELTILFRTAKPTLARSFKFRKIFLTWFQ